MTALQFPCTVFKTQNRMDDYDAKDMRCGDLTAQQLKKDFHLVDVSSRVDPWSLTRLSPFARPQSMFHGSRPPGEKISREVCANILFDEMRSLSHTFSLYGPYSHLIGRMIDHMQYEDGRPFSSLHLDSALREHILRDRTSNSTLKLLQVSISQNINREKGIFPASLKHELTKTILDGKLPKFDRLQDNFNGLGITVHDTWATHITIKWLKIQDNHYRALVNYKVQDHFGLDSADILKPMFNHLRFFRLWFLLQRYNRMGFKPFMTNLEASVEISGSVK